MLHFSTFIAREHYTCTLGKIFLHLYRDYISDFSYSGVFMVTAVYNDKIVRGTIYLGMVGWGLLRSYCVNSNNLALLNFNECIL